MSCRDEELHARYLLLTASTIFEGCKIGDSEVRDSGIKGLGIKD